MKMILSRVPFFTAHSLVGSVRSPDNKAEARNQRTILYFTVVTVNSDYLLAILEVDVGKRSIATLGADALDTTLILIEVNV